MRYLSLYNMIRALPDKPPSEEENRKTVGIAIPPDKWPEMQAKLTGEFVPTPFPLVNALVQAHSPVIKYNAKRVPVTIFNPRTQRAWIRLPPPDAFDSPLAYTHVVVHEMAHWVKWVDPNDTRTRKLKEYEDNGEMPDFSFTDMMRALAMGTEALGPYGLEEMAAETAAFLVMQRVAPGVETDTMVRYIHTWGQNLREVDYSRDDVDKLLSIAQELAYDAAAYLLRPLNLTPMETS